MKKYFSLLLVLAMCLAACDGKKSDEKKEESAKSSAIVESSVESEDQGLVFVDLGLPSGTKWKAVNEEGFYDYDEAVNKYGASLPSKEQLEELKGCCVWEWNGEGCVVKGPNGNSITLPAAGVCSDGELYEDGDTGYYWSSTPDGSDYTWSLVFLSSEVTMYGNGRSNGCSVRLVK